MSQKSDAFCCQPPVELTALESRSCSKERTEYWNCLVWPVFTTKRRLHEWSHTTLFIQASPELRTPEESAT
ncbi:MAG TPA: hypothetical protein DIW81_19735 [Planctomycetaceae bacterium]|nr:hypothetical protein [Planctomycetaceae bacterium]